MAPLVAPLVYIDPGNVFGISLFDDVFEIKTKYHNFIAFLLILTHTLSYQDGIIVRSLFLPLLTKVCILVKLKIISLEILVQCCWLYPFYHLINLQCRTHLLAPGDRTNTPSTPPRTGFQRNGFQKFFKNENYLINYTRENHWV